MTLTVNRNPAAHLAPASNPLAIPGLVALIADYALEPSAVLAHKTINDAMSRIQVDDIGLGNDELLAVAHVGLAVEELNEAIASEGSGESPSSRYAIKFGFASVAQCATEAASQLTGKGLDGVCVHLQSMAHVAQAAQLACQHDADQGFFAYAPHLLRDYILCSPMHPIGQHAGN